MIKTCSWTFSAVATLLLSAAPALAQETVKIGFHAPQTGFAAADGTSFGAPTEREVRLAAHVALTGEFFDIPDAEPPGAAVLEGLDSPPAGQLLQFLSLRFGQT